MTRGKISGRRAERSVNRVSTLRARPTANLTYEVGTDDVIRALLELFHSLGLDSGQFASRIKNVNSLSSDRKRCSDHASIIGDLITIWNQDPKYLDRFGNPKPIKMKGSDSFTQLALRCAPSMNARKVLLDLKRLGAIRIDKKGLIHPLRRSIPVYEDEHLAAKHTLATLHGFIKTLRHNLSSNTSNSEQLFHRIAWNRDFDIGAVPRLKIWLKRHGQHFLESADNWMVRNSDKISPPKKARKRAEVSVGLYLAVDQATK